MDLSTTRSSFSQHPARDAPGSAKASRSRSGPAGTDSGLTSHCSRHMPPKSSSVCLTTLAKPNSNGSNYRSLARICPRPVPRPSTPTAFMVPTSRTSDIASIRTKLDPFAKQLVGQLRWGPELFGYQLDQEEPPQQRGVRPAIYDRQLLLSLAKVSLFFVTSECQAARGTIQQSVSSFSNSTNK